MKYIYLLSSLVLVICIFGTNLVNGQTSVCGKMTPDQQALSLGPCVQAALNVSEPVPYRCCVVIKEIGQNPSCLCAIMLSKIVKNLGIKPEVSITIPKRCNIVDRPVGYKCGNYTLP
ncbi:hypothetical protein vseg_006628 [Gypsophila vaccaria]